MSMLNNAVSSIRLGVEDFQAADCDQARALSAIRNLTAGLLLLFKVKLQQLSPPNSAEALIKERLEPVFDANGVQVWVGKGTKTVDVQSIIDRLTSLGVNDVDWKQLKKLTEIRNSVEHYYTPQPVSQLLAAVAASFHLIQQFVPRHLDMSPIQLLGEQIWGFLTTQEAFYKKDLDACQQANENLNWPIPILKAVSRSLECVHCRSLLIRPHDPIAMPPKVSFVCTKCAATTDYSNALDRALNSHYRGEMYLGMTKGDPPLLDCPRCFRLTFLSSHSFCPACM
ncbi:hypothetical protein [Pseudomonas putida]|uniref:hypothetical protein n=1 Tax=Pseudomonas putida TaxID=303 RepID=UPI0013A6D12F|nr:hypothetical protein [Pseudomonas putida]